MQQSHGSNVAHCRFCDYGEAAGRKKATSCGCGFRRSGDASKEELNRMGVQALRPSCRARHEHDNACNPGFVANEHAGFAFGVAQKALDIIISASYEKRRGIPPVTSRERASFQRAVGACDLKLRAARQLVYKLNEAAWNTVQSGKPLDLRQQTELCSCVAYATEVAVEVVMQAYRFAGGSAVFSSNILARIFHKKAQTSCKSLIEWKV